MTIKKVVILTTGGTVASMYNQKTGLLTSGKLEGEKLVEMCNLPDDIELTVESVCQVSSTAMDFETVIKLMNRIKEIFEDDSVSGVVVTHGSVTLEETAYFLGITIADSRPVVVTGSQRGPLELGTDALLNIRQAVLVAAEDNCRKMGTIVVFNEKIFPARHVKKVHAYNVNGFDSPGFGYFGYVDRDEVYIYQKPVRRETYQLKEPIPIVDIVKFGLGSDGRFIQHAIDSGAKGIVLEAGGRGHAPRESVGIIDQALEEGIKVVLTTSCLEGQVYPVYDYVGGTADLEKRGVILGKDYDSKKARIKLSVLLATGIETIEEKFKN